MDDKKKVDLAKIGADIEQLRRMSGELTGQDAAESVWPADFDASGEMNTAPARVDLFDN